MPLEQFAIIALLTLLPGLELRAGILFGLSQGMDALQVFALAVAVNALLGPIVLFALQNILPFFLKINVLEKFYAQNVLRVQKDYKKYIEKYGGIGLALFIAVPLPGAGSWSGALAAFLMGMKIKKFAIVNFVGVLIAGIIVTLAGLGIISLFGL